MEYWNRLWTLSSDSALFYNFISLLIMTVIIILVIIGLKSDRFDKITFSVIIGGAIEIFYDRVALNAVPDFIDIHYGNFHWFTFNIDIFITIGIMLLLLKEFFKKKA